MLKKCLLFCFVFLFVACSSKNEISINKEINSFSLNKTINIAGVPSRVKSPVAINLGLGGRIARHVGIGVGTSVRPTISNDDALNLEKAFNLHNINLANLIKNEFTNQMNNSNHYKHKFVPFGANYTIHLSVPKYEFDSSIVSSKSYIKVFMELMISNKQGDIIYKDDEVNSSNLDKLSYTQSEMIRNNEFINRALQESLSNVIAKLILNMSKSN